MYNIMFYREEEQPDRRRQGFLFLPVSAGSWSLEGPVSSPALSAEGGCDQQGGGSDVSKCIKGIAYSIGQL